MLAESEQHYRVRGPLLFQHSQEQLACVVFWVPCLAADPGEAYTAAFHHRKLRHHTFVTSGGCMDCPALCAHNAGLSCVCCTNPLSVLSSVDECLFWQAVSHML